MFYLHEEIKFIKAQNYMYLILKLFEPPIELFY